jgi:hypothetical protein
MGKGGGERGKGKRRGVDAGVYKERYNSTTMKI